MAQKVELRKRSGSSFAGNDNLMLPVTHVNYVLGLLDGNEKLNTSLLPDSMLSTKRMAGSINVATNFGNLYDLIKSFNDNKDAMYPGTYFIANGKQLISASTDHVIYYNDDGLNASGSVELENGDHLFYVKYGSEYVWVDTENTLTVDEDTGITNLAMPYSTMSGKNVFATEQEAASFPEIANGQYGLITGYKWVPTNFSGYNTSGYKIEKNTSQILGGADADVNAVNHLLIPSYALWDYGQESVGFRLEDNVGGYTYWKLTEVDDTIQIPKLYNSVTYSNQHIWGVVNNSYNLATSTSAGLMSAADKVKLNTLSTYTHPTQEPISIEASGIEVIGTFTSDASGHVTGISTRTLSNADTSFAGLMSASDKVKLNGLENYEHPAYTARNIKTSGVEVVDTFTSDITGHVGLINKRTLPNATTDAVGVVELATTGEGQTGTDGSRALTPAAGLAMLKYNQDFSYFESLAVANASTLPNGATAIIATGTITIP